MNESTSVIRPAQPLTSTRERVVLADEAGHPIGFADKASVHTHDTRLHLAFSCYVFDPRGRFLLTRRADTKITWPGVWTNSCCGHLAPGEAALDAVLRRSRQELGVELGEVSPVLPDFRYRAVMDNGMVENEICPVFAALCERPERLTPDPAEVAEYAWVDWPAFRAEVLSGRRNVSPWCVEQVAQLPKDLPVRILPG